MYQSVLNLPAKVDHFKKMYEAERDSGSKLRASLDEARHEKQEALRERDDQLNQARAIGSKSEQAESEKRTLTLELNKAESQLEQVKLQADNERRDLER